MLKHLTTSAVLAIHEKVIEANGSGSCLWHKALLESAVAAPQATFGGEPVIADPVETAAAYLFYLRKNHPFVDGNKRTALASCLVFLNRNELLEVSTLDVDKWEAFVLEVAASKMDRGQVTIVLRELLKS
ncbi:type II toxin-antitoxin system death-on-curing family toxin [Rubritalea spongiae]|uniref:Type II toxin-antitoxin system death-on-curing family toxin n=1 Tax=Rubritalea spongiae TaxID=430797 RepID=A0ABW5E898_9BACT